MTRRELVMVGAEWPQAHNGGLNTYFAELAHALARSEALELKAFAYGAPPSWPGALGQTGPEPPLRNRMLHAHRLARAALARGAIVDTHFAPHSPLFLGSRPDSRRRPRVVHFHGPWADEAAHAGEPWLHTRLKWLIEWRAYAGATRFIALSDTFRDLLVSEYGVHMDDVSVIPGGVDTVKFHPDSRVRRAHHTVFAVRRLERRMGLDVLLDAWGAVCHEFPEARLRIAGDGSQREDLQRRSHALGLDRSVTFLGGISDADLIKEYQGSTVSAIPSLTLEGFGLVALESLACGTPVIATRVGGLPSVLSELDPRSLVPPGDPQSLAAGLIQALHGNRPTSEACAEHAGAYSWESIAARHLKLYSEI